MVLVYDELVKDEHVRQVAIASCLNEIFQIMAPDAPPAWWENEG